jgi:hypothetical protein
MLTLPCESEPLLTALRARGIFGGINCCRHDPALRRQLLIAVTATKESLDDIVRQFRKVASEAAVAPFSIETAPHTTPTAKIIKDEAAFITLLKATKNPSPE